MPSIRRAKVEDLHQMQNCNLWCLPQNYDFKYYLYHYASWSSQIYVAEENNKICGYVLSKMDDENDSKPQPHGHITSLSILRTHRRLGLANKLMNYSHQSMQKIQNCEYVSLHVRRSNRAALSLYKDKLGYQIVDTDLEYYADGQDAFDMRKYFKKKEQQAKKIKN